MSRVVIVPYKMASKAAKALKESLVAEGVRCFRIRHNSRTFRPRRSDKTIYYGGREVTLTLGRTFNAYRRIALDKLGTFRVLSDQGISTVPWTTDKHVAETWPTTVERHTLTGHSGAGIRIVSFHPETASLWDAPLYTKYTKRSHEYRVHVFNGSVIDCQIKRKITGAGEVDKHVRNKHTGWVYCRDNFEPTDTLKQLAIQAVAAVELDFGAVDIIYSKREDSHYVLEINTAPGLEGTTLLNYTKAIKDV